MRYEEIAEKLNLELIGRFPRDKLKENRLLPFRQESDYLYFLSDITPLLPVIDELAVYSGEKIKVKKIPDILFEQLFSEYLAAPLETVEGMLGDLKAGMLDDFGKLDLDSSVENLEEMAQEAPVIRLVNAMLTAAIKQGASDIHLEPFESRLELRYRIDGVLYQNPAPPREIFPAIATRIKIMARLNIAERRLPQEGRIRIKVLGRELDIRVSFISTLYGESIVLRLLDRAAYLLELGNLGFAAETLATYLDLIQHTNGIILVAGPTGSGKTTTLYATLQQLNSPEKKLITVEDPVEYQLNGVNQIQVRPEIDLTFARGLRSILRQDPDIIMIGEIRDLETAQIAIQAALTGHLVLATLHTNDASEAIIRLLNMGVEDYLLAATLKGVLAQRLVRTLCPDCKTPLAEGGLKQEHLYQSRGCGKCNGIGYRGRTGIYELLAVNPMIEEQIIKQSNASALRAVASKCGFKTLLADGKEKVSRGITTRQELLRVTRN